MSAEHANEGVDPMRLEDLFARGCELVGAERDRFLQAECGGGRMLEELVSLLAAHDEAQGRVQPVDPGRAASLLDSVRGATGEETIGPYRIVQTLGEGGMGTVFLAERIEGGFDQKVALKLVKKGMDSRSIVERFQQERQILAQLQHPGITRLFDGGLSSDGRPYFAMEFVDGESILEFSKVRGLDLEARIDLFLQVCGAVQQAHRNLVVHRDLKPSNILVTREGEVKLLDFGIAKVLDPVDEAGAGRFTRLGLRALTPEYASPEQIRGESVTTASDVYGLGVVLFELLTGRLPYEGKLTNPSDFVRAVCESEPLSASTAARRHADVVLGERAARSLQGDLDAILSKALAGELDRRYASVEAFAEDLRRFRAGQPVQARSLGTAYRLGKFVRRHTLGVVLGATLLLALVLGLLGTTWQATVAAEERNRAAAQLLKTEAVQEFLTSLLQSIDPYQTAGGPWTADQLLDQGVARIEEGVPNEPEVEADLLGVLGGVSRSLGQLERAEDLWRRSLAIRREQFSETSPELAEGLRGLAAVLYLRDENEETSELLEEALRIERKRRDETPDVSALPLAKTLGNLGVQRLEVDRFAEARALFQEAIALSHGAGGDQRSEIAQLQVNLASLEMETGHLAVAEHLLREALDTERNVLGPEHPKVALTLGLLAMTLRQSGDLEGPEPLYREAIAIARGAFGDEHPEVSTKLNNFAALLRSRGEYEEAAELFAQVLELDQRLLGADHVYVAFSMDNLATVLTELGRLDEALGLFERARGILVASRGPLSKDVATNRAGAAVAVSMSGKPAQAVQLFEQALSIYAETLPAGHARVALLLAELAGAHADMNHVEEAEHLFREALRMRHALGQSSHPETVGALVGLGRLLARDHRSQEALATLEEAARVASATLPPGHWRRSDAELALAGTLAAAGDVGRARSLLDAAGRRLATQIGVRAEELRQEDAAIRDRWAMPGDASR